MKRMIFAGLGCVVVALAASTEVGTAAVTTRPADDIVRAKLAEPVPVMFDANRFTDVIKFLSNVTGLRFNVDWPALEKVEVTKDSPVALQLNDVPLASELRFLLRRVALEGQLTYRIEDGTVVITTPKPGETPPAALPADEKVTQKLGETVPVKFAANHLKDVISYVRNISGVNVYADWIALYAVGITPETPITLELNGASIATVLDGVLSAAEAGREKMVAPVSKVLDAALAAKGWDKPSWTIEGNVVVIAAKKANPGAGAATQPASK
jgi:hypothetical protein